MDFIEVKIEEFDDVYFQMEKSFPVFERRTYSQAKDVLNEKDYTLFHIRENGNKVGFISVWQLDGFFFVEHFAICEDYRNHGLGAKALNLAKKKWQTIVLEAEPPIAEVAKRRLNFYKRNGFCVNQFKYMQPAYQEGEKDVELIILSCPDVLANEKLVVSEIYKRVYGR